MVQLEYPIEMELAGPTAMWTRPDTGDSPVSYPVPTYAAVKGIFEAVLWGPAVEIVPTKVEICKPIQYHSYVTNYGGPLREPKSIKKGNQYQLYATVLIDVCYRLYAIAKPAQNKQILPEKALRWDRKTSSPGHAYQEIFKRRLARGQSYGSICLGWKEFTPSYFGPFRSETQIYTMTGETVIPSMLRQTFSEGYRTDFKPVYDLNLILKEGTLLYPRGGASDD